MIHEFQIPCIVDTKNIYKTFAKTRYIDKQTIPMLKKISTQRKALKETLKHLTTLRSEEPQPFILIDEAISYAEAAADLVVNLLGVFLKYCRILSSKKITQSPKTGSGVLFYHKLNLSSTVKVRV